MRTPTAWTVTETVRPARSTNSIPAKNTPPEHDGSSEDTMLVYPGLVKDVTGATVVYDNVQIKATPLNQPFEYSIGNDDLIEWEQTFREII